MENVMHFTLGYTLCEFFIRLIFYGKKGGVLQGDGELDKAERLMLQFQGIRSPNSLSILCLS